MNNPFAGLPNGAEVASQFELLRAIFHWYDFIEDGPLRWQVWFPSRSHLLLRWLTNCHNWYVQTTVLGSNFLNTKQYQMQNVARMLTRSIPPHCRKRTFNELAGREEEFEKQLCVKLATCLPYEVAIEAAEVITRREVKMEAIIGTKHWAAAAMAQKLEGYFLIVEQVRMEVLNGCY